MEILEKPSRGLSNFNLKMSLLCGTTSIFRPPYPRGSGKNFGENYAVSTHQNPMIQTYFFMQVSSLLISYLAMGMSMQMKISHCRNLQLDANENLPFTFNNKQLHVYTTPPLAMVSFGSILLKFCGHCKHLWERFERRQVGTQNTAELTVEDPLGDLLRN